MLVIAAAAVAFGNGSTFVVSGERGPGKGKHVVLLAGDEEYRSEEMLPQLAKILARRHGFKCTVVFSQNERGEIDPEARRHQPGLEALRSADVCVMMLRFRQWEDAQMKHFVDYYLSGKPIVAVRTSTHAFDYPPDCTSKYRKFGWQSREWPGGFGKQVLGETWVSHWGVHGSQATRGRIVSAHPVVRDVRDVFGTTDVYEAAPPSDAEVLVRGEVVAGLLPTDPAAVGRKKTSGGSEQGLNDPMMPIVWVRQPKNEAGRTNRVLTCTMGSATDFANPGLRRLLVNSVYWAVELRVPSNAQVDLVGRYVPSPFGFGGYRKGVRPSNLE
jgi:hypothetical protein